MKAGQLLVCLTTKDNSLFLRGVPDLKMITDSPLAPRPAVFLDRDNTLTHDEGYTYKLQDFSWKAGALEGLKCFADAGLLLFIITNQGGIGRELFSEADMHAFNNKLCSDAAQAGAAITDIAFCPHHPKAITAALRGPCDCRKPAAGMIFQLAKKWHIDCTRSLVIGDRPSDVEAGNKAGCHSYLIDDSQRLDEFANQLLKIHRPTS